MKGKAWWWVIGAALVVGVGYYVYRTRIAPPTLRGGGVAA